MKQPPEEPFFRELEHTADLGIEVDGDSAAEIFRRAGLALYALMVSPKAIETREERRVSLNASGWEDCLHDWLSNLLGTFLREGFVGASITIDRLSATGIDSRVAGEKLDWNRHEFLTEIKAVTYHELRVERIGDRWRARVIFDV